jgi:hypothetical protein
MANLILNGSTSGSVTLSSPAVSGTTTLTLPTTSGTVLTSASSIATSQLSGSIASSSLPAGSVLQVVNATYSTQVSTASGSYSDTGLTASITPSSSSSKILIIVQQVGCGKATNDTTLQLKLLRNSTDLYWFERSGAWTGSGAYNYIGTCGISYLDSPATTSSVTYKTQMAAFSAAATVYTQFNVGAGVPASTITLMEIKG